MKEKNYPTRALAVYYRAIARQPRVAMPLDDLPSWTCEETMNEKDDVIVCHGSRMLAVYRVKPDGLLRRLKRWPKECHLCPEGSKHGRMLRSRVVPAVSRLRRPRRCLNPAGSEASWADVFLS